METAFRENTNYTGNKNGNKENDNGKERMSEKYSHIKGWGIDADPDNEPTYPMKKYTGDDHRRSDYVRPPQQPVTVEILHSNERPSVSAVFGTVSPPSGLSGVIRRYAFRYSEESLKHWFALVLADRVNVIEGIIDDLRKGIVPNIIAEKGLKAEWQHNRKGVIKKAAIAVGIAATLLVILNAKKKSAKLVY
jgi:hypothetical protein